MGFCESHYDFSLFTQKFSSDLVIVLVYMDGLLIIRSHLVLIQQVRTDLQHKFKMKDLGELKFFLGIKFSRSQKKIIMCQSKYALELVSQMRLSGCKPFSTPLEFNDKLTFLEFDKHIRTNNSKQDELLDDYVQVLSRFMDSPKQSHMEATCRVVRYIKGIVGLGLFMPSNRSTSLVAYCDSDWGTCVETRRSITRYIVKFGDSVIS